MFELWQQVGVFTSILTLILNFSPNFSVDFNSLRPKPLILLRVALGMSDAVCR